MDLTLLRDLHAPGPRQGPGSAAHTKRAIEIIGIDPAQSMTVLDIGCGTGASTRILAESLNAHIYAIDIFPEFLRKIGNEIKITPIACSMDALPFSGHHFDLIWSEGAIYSMGFARGIKYIKQFLEPGGIVAVSEIIWTTEDRPREIQDFWDEGYPEIATASGKIEILKNEGYTVIDHFVLPPGCWTDNYYTPLQERFPTFLSEQKNSDAAKQLVETEKAEIALYEKFSDYYSYGFFIARNPS